MRNRVKFVCLVLFLGLPFFADAQHFSVNLSQKHAAKLNALKSGKKRLIKYYKYYKKDSTQYMRKQEKHYKKAFDSTRAFNTSWISINLLGIHLIGKLLRSKYSFMETLSGV